MSFPVTDENRIVWALHDLLAGDPTIAAYWGSAIDVIEPSIEAAWLTVPQLLLQPVPQRDVYSRQIGDIAAVEMHVLLTAVEWPERVRVTRGDWVFNDMLVFLERTIEAGTLGDGNGWLVDPDWNNVGEPPYLNQRMNFSRETPEELERDDGSVLYLLPSIVSYEMQQNRLTREVE